MAQTFTARIHGGSRSLRIIAATPSLVLYDCTLPGEPTIQNCAMSRAGFERRYPEALRLASSINKVGG